LSEKDIRVGMRWVKISMVFQGAMNCLTPVFTVGQQMRETIQTHKPMTRQDAEAVIAKYLGLVGLPADVVHRYPHELSGGMKQRVVIATALFLEPKVVILDEPTTALDVIVEREILEHIRGLQRRLGFAVLFITHDLARMLQFADRVAIFYAAQLVEIGPAATLRDAARHPYTQGLLRAFPSLRSAAGERASIPGAPPSLAHPPAGCRFHPRCPRAVDLCRQRSPELLTLAPGHAAACHLAG
jgi:peptide/nickel transport system ATP-binding protein